jgi:hypothetical protein
MTLNKNKALNEKRPKLVMVKNVNEVKQLIDNGELLYNTLEFINDIKIIKCIINNFDNIPKLTICHKCLKVEVISYLYKHNLITNNILLDSLDDIDYPLYEKNNILYSTLIDRIEFMLSKKIIFTEKLMYDTISSLNDINAIELCKVFTKYDYNLQFMLYTRLRFELAKHLTLTCNVNIPYKKMYPIHYQDINVVLLFKDNGADINAKDAYGKTVLFDIWCYTKKAKSLIENGVNVNIKDNNGKYAFDDMIFTNTVRYLKMIYNIKNKK